MIKDNAGYEIFNGAEPLSRGGSSNPNPPGSYATGTEIHVVCILA